MHGRINNRTDLPWRMAPWLALAAITMTVLSYAPAAGGTHHHGKDMASHECGKHDHAHHRAKS